MDSILTDDRSSREIRTRVASAILAVAAAATISTAAMADVTFESVRAPPPPPQPAKVLQTGYKVTEIAKGLDHPWSMAFLPDGSILVTERAGRLRVIKGGSLLPRTIAGVPPVHTGSQAGLFDIVLHPNFAANNIVYLTYAAGTSAANGTHLRRIHLDERGNVVDQEELLNDLHWRIRDVRAAPDGYLYVCTDEDDGRVLRLEPTTH